MDARSPARLARRLTVAVAVVMLAAGCRVELTPTSSDIDRAVDPAVVVPSTDSANCAVSTREAHAERRTVCSG